MRLLIVDDEQMTRDSLLALIPTKSLGIREVATACNGRQAWSQALTSPPNIVLCDVRMPKMDGLELATLLREKYPDVKIIFISGYADKEYLKTAISLQATAYVEKPIDVDELVKVLKKAADQIRQERSAQLKSSLLQDSEHKLSRIVRQQLVNELAKAPLALSELQKRYGETYLDWPDSGACSAACFRLGWSDRLNGEKIEPVCTELQTRVDETFAAALGDRRKSVVSGFRSTDSIAIFFSGERDSLETFYECTHALHRKFCDHRSFVLSTGIGKSAETLSGMPECYRQAEALARWLAFTGAFGIGTYADGRGEESIFEEGPQRFRQMIRAGDACGARMLLIDLFRKLKAQPIGDIAKVSALYDQLLLYCLDAHGIRFSMTGGPYTKIGLVSMFQKLRTLEEMSGFVLLRLDELFPTMRIPEGASPKVAQAIEYIQSRIADKELSVHKIAKALFLSENYLCSLYKKEVGTTLNKSIINARVERAKRLLMQDDKLYEVAIQVGFSDPNYFSAVFKKQTGISPSGYRRRVSAGPLSSEHEP